MAKILDQQRVLTSVTFSTKSNNQMTRLLTVVFVALLLFVAISILLPTFIVKRYYYYSPDKRRVVTRVEYLPYILSQSTYFTLGLYEEITPPKNHIRPIYSGRDGGFVLLMHWTDSSCNFYFPHGLYGSRGLGSSFQLIKLDQASDQWKEMAADTVGGNNKILTEYTF